MADSNTKEIALRIPRPTGVQRAEARMFALSIVRDPEYRKNLLIYARARMLPPAIEAMLWAYAYGRPVERVDVNVSQDPSRLEGLSRQELAERARLLSEVLSDDSILDGLSEEDLQKKVDESISPPAPLPFKRRPDIEVLNDAERELDARIARGEALPEDDERINNDDTLDASLDPSNTDGLT